MQFTQLRLAITILLAVMPLCQSANGQSRSSRLAVSSSYAPDGVLEPWKTSNVACVEPGLLESLQVELGERVSVGQPLARLEASALVTQLAIVEAQAAALGRQIAARADTQLNQRRVEALQAARENRYSSQSELERAQADLSISQGRLTAEIEEQEVLRLQVARLKHQIAQRTVVAPIPGIVSKFHRELGEYVSPTAPEILQIVDVSRLRASFFLQVVEVKSLPKNGQVQVRLDDGNETMAEVEYVSPVSDGESALIEVRVLIDNPDLKILGSRCALLLPDGLRSNEAAPRS